MYDYSEVFLKLNYGLQNQKFLCGKSEAVYGYTEVFLKLEDELIDDNQSLADYTVKPITPLMK